MGACYWLVTLWGLVIYLSCHIPLIEMRVEDDPYKYTQQQPATTLKPEPPRVELKLGKCFHMTRDRCPTDGKCIRVDAVSIFCCDVDSLQSLKDNLALPMSQNTTNLHVLNASIAELDLSQAVFRRLVSMAITDGAIGKIVGQFPKHSSIACLNISNNNLTGASLQPSQRPFAYLFALTVLDASSNNLTEFPLSLVSNRKISVDLSGNNYLPCKHIQKVMELNSSLVTFENYNKTFCRLDLQWNWFEDVQIVPIEHVKMQTQLNVRCAMIQPPNINCSCVPDRLEVHDGAVTNLVAVDCSQRHLKELPSDLPPNTVKLNVSYNNITSLQAVASDPSYEHLRQLLVDYNDIDNIVELEGTKFIDNFMLFSISHNKLKTIHTYVFSNKFDSNDQYNTISIGGNYIYCDCNTEKVIKPWLLENLKIIGDYRALQCQENMGAVVDLIEYQVCHSPRDWTEYIYYIIALEVIILVLLISKVSYDYWVFKTAGYLPWPANKMPRLPCDWLCE